MINEPLIKPGNEEKLCFQRHIGAIEIYNGHRWKEVSYKECYICNNYAYTLFFWNPILARSNLKKITLPENNPLENIL